MDTSIEKQSLQGSCRDSLQEGQNALFYGDCLDNLREYVGDETVDGCYLDPPFNSDATYNRPFRRKEQGKQTKAPAMAFHDMWHWDEASRRAYERLCASPRAEISDMARGLYLILGEKPMTAYCFYMAERLLEIHRVLKPTGSVYLHCDPTASHYLKVIMDAIFGEKNFRNEVIWRIGWVSGFKTQKRGWIRNHDTLLYYTKTPAAQKVFNKEYLPYPPDYVRRDGSKPRGKGIPLEDTWNCHSGDRLDSIMIKSLSTEKLGYPTQKPLALLERIIKACSNEGDVILDPFCGCGTTLHAAQKLNRRWLGMDISYGAINVVKERLQDAFPDDNLQPGHGFTVYNAPDSYAAAVQLAHLEAEEVQQVEDKNKGSRRKKHQARYDFQNFILGQIRDARGRLLLQPSQSLSRDGGIDGWGTLYLGVDEKGEDKEGLILVQVKTSKRIGRREIDEFYGVMKAEAAAMGIFISLYGHRANGYEEVLSREAKERVELLQERAFVHPLDGRAWPEFQFWSVSDLMENRQPQIPSYARSEVPRAVREEEETQLRLEVP
ncbi:hypothetical protein C6495_08855 [Candidatus Poribacteria bacterium]|nr:MAG: hypothetical protein C6495_08855 [Candidatus Poribacteria bacterium]